uniref:Uncharacterized protein n=1 Tax=viral metagenome TaxID=1070528 RepID=A0A6C0LTF7_9ZZZZ
MISLQEIIKYVGLIAIIYFLVKAFSEDKLSTNQVLLLSLLILIVAAFVLYKSKNECIKIQPIQKNEHYQITDPPVTDSIYPGPENREEKLDSVEEDPSPLNGPNIDKDIRDFKDIMTIDKKTYAALIAEEQRAEDRIKNNYRDEMVYTSTHPFNTIPLGTQLYGYTYLPPENWFRAYERPPVCVTDKRCPVCPVAEGGKTSGLMEFDTSNNVVGPDGINLRYVKKILNKDK